jgi:hypothetical protein
VEAFGERRLSRNVDSTPSSIFGDYNVRSSNICACQHDGASSWRALELQGLKGQQLPLYCCHMATTAMNALKLADSMLSQLISDTRQLCVLTQFGARSLLIGAGPRTPFGALSY